MHAEAFLPARPALLEREPEVSAIRELVRSARGGTGRLLVAEGSAGIGKTRLLSEARAAAEASGLGVIAARGGELEQGFAFGIVRQLFEPLLARFQRRPHRLDDRCRGPGTAAVRGVAVRAGAGGTGRCVFRHAPWPVLAARRPGVPAADARSGRRPALGR